MATCLLVQSNRNQKTQNINTHRHIHHMYTFHCHSAGDHRYKVWSSLVIPCHGVLVMCIIMSAMLLSSTSSYHVLPACSVMSSSINIDRHAMIFNRNCHYAPHKYQLNVNHRDCLLPLHTVLSSPTHQQHLSFQHHHHHHHHILVMCRYTDENRQCAV